MLPAGVHELASGLPKQISIGTTKAFKNGYAFHYTMKSIAGANDRGVYVCPTTTETGRDGEQMFILFSEGYWYACEGTFEENVANPFEIRQACFRTKADFWKADWHSWDMNGSRDNTPGCKYRDGQWSAGEWSGELWCATK